ncbi:hypothetical protein [Campylobacter sp.]|uniref:hypothetical protein n=1 Tax=Campylobacter sp. TaxID=205 RepID=UPI0025C3247F|nr:hypothetical protein [Campylobacter sp.]
MKLVKDSNLNQDEMERETRSLEYSLEKIQKSNPSIFYGELRKLGFEKKEILSMETEKVTMNVDGFLVNSQNREGLNAMNQEVKKILKDSEDIEQFKKFEYLFLNTNKIKDIPKGFYANRKINVNKYIKDCNMEEVKFDRSTNAISLLSEKNIKIIQEYTNKLQKDLKHGYLKKVKLIESNYINFNCF